jgi:hypothetical protein
LALLLATQEREGGHSLWASWLLSMNAVRLAVVAAQLFFLESMGGEPVVGGGGGAIPTAAPNQDEQ